MSKPRHPGMIIAVLFFVQAASGAGLFARIPDVQAALGLGEATLGLVLMGLPVGSFLSFPFAANLIDRVGTRATTAWPTLAIAVAALAFTIAPNAWVAFLALAVNGAGFSISNIAMNLEADRFEAQEPKKIMSLCHGFWSVGFLAASALAVVARSYDLSAPVQMGLTLPIIALGLIVLSMQMSPYPRRNPREDRARIALPVPSKAVAAIAAFGFASVALHGATTNWSVLYLQDEMGAAQGAAALSIPLFMAALTVARLLGDRITRRFSAAQIAYGSLFLAMLGAVIVLGATTLWVAALGFAIMGLGTALHYPLMVTAAAKLTDRPSSQNIAALTMILSVSILFVPLLIGAVAEMWGLRVGMGLMIPALALSFLFARALASTEPDA